MKFFLCQILLLLSAVAGAADIVLPPTIPVTTTFGPANTTSSNSAGTVVQSPAVATVKTGRLLLNNFKVAQGAGFSCQLVPFFPSAPTASPSPVAAKTTSLSVAAVQWYLGEGTVNYTWSKASGPGTVTFSGTPNGTNAAKSGVTATFSLSGTYAVRVTATGADGSANYYDVSVTVNATKTDVVVTPASATTVRGGLVAFTGTSRDQFGTALSDQPPIAWSVAPTSAGTFLSQGDYLLEASGADIWGTNDGFRFVHQEMIGDGTITAKVEYLENTNAWAKAGVMIRDGVADNAVNAMANVTAGSGALFQRRLTAGTASSNNITAGLAAPYWVRLTRVGNALTGFASPDGSTWTQLGTDTVTMSPTVRVGLAVTSHQAGVRAQARFSNVSITPGVATAGALPSGWTQQDINITTPVGSGTYTPSTGTYTIQAAGADIWGTSDQFRFVHRPLPAGDVTLIARVASLTNTHASAKAGLMIRDGLTADAINVMVDVTPTSGVAFQRRTALAGSTSSTTVGGLASPRWLKLTRVGTTVATYASADGKAWRTIGSASVTMGTTLYAGLAVTSHNATTLTTAVFDNVQILTGTSANALATPQWPWQTQDIGTIVLAGSAYTATAPGVFWADLAQLPGGPYTVTATATGVPTAGLAAVTITNGTPIISIAAKSSASPVTGISTVLSAYGDDDAGEPGLTYTWTTTGTPPDTVAYSINSTNTAKTTTVTFKKAGTYTFRVTATDANGAVSAPSDVTVTVNQTATSVAMASSPVVLPVPVQVITNTTQQFSAVLLDQFTAAMAVQPDAATGWTWSVPAAAGTVSATGLFTASATVNGPYTLSATAIASAKTSNLQVSVVAPPVITIAATDATATEFSTTADNGLFTITRSGIITVPVTVNLTTTGTATAGTDYTALPTTVTVPANATTTTVSVAPINDATPEANETIIATVAAGSGYTVGSPAAATVTLIDDEQRVSIAATDASAAEAGLNTGTFTITRTGTTAADLSVAFTVSGTATSVSDYAALTSPVVIPAGASSTTITVTPVDDTTGEVSETVIATLAANAAYTVVGSAATVTITDNDALVTMVATDATATESSTASDTGTVTITRTGSTTAALTVNLTITGTASATADYTALPTTATIPIGAASTTLTVTPVDNATAEPNETVILTIAAGTGYTPGTPSAATITIIDDEQGVSIAATDATASEATTVTDTGTFTITRTGVTTNPLTVNLTTTGTASSGTDYTALPATVVIAAGANTATLAVTPLNDNTGEPNETIILTVAAGTDYTVSTPSAATVTLVDDDQYVTIAATDATASEPGTDKGTFTITRSGLTTAALTVNFTVSGSATAGTDYTSIGTSATINAGATTAIITVTPLDDAAYEGSETVIATLAADPTYTLGTAKAATVTIADNDLPTITIAATDASAAEPSNNGVFTLTRSGITTGTLTVTVTPGGTATATSDYNALPGTVTFSAGQPTATVTVTPVNDGDLESSETVTLTVAPGTGYNVGSPSTATVTLLDDEQGITITATDATASETSGDTGTFTITRTSGVPTPALTINLAVPTGSAVSGADYGTLPTTVAFAANQTTATVTLTPIDDTLSEADETVTLAIAPGTGYLLGSPSSATITIQDNDVPTITFLAASSSISEAGTQLDIPVVLSRSHTAVVTVAYALTGTALGNGDDYYLPNGTLTFAIGETSKTLSLLVRDDATVESNETAIITLSGPVNGSLGSIPVHTATITDNDAITVQVAATDPVVNEDGAHYSAVTFTRTGALTAALTANLSLTGSTATVGTDFTDPTDTGTKITFPIGVASVTRAVVAKQDTLQEADETIVLTVIAGTGYTVGTPNVATLTIRDDDVITIAATTPIATEAATPINGVFTLTRVSTTNALTVSVAITGTATAGSDYTQNPTGTTVTFNAGVAVATLTVTPVQDALVEGPETVIATIIPSSPTPTYTIGASASATVTITDDDVPTVTIAATDATAVEPGGDNATFTITRTGATTSALTVNYQVSGTATAGLDYTALSGTATINASSASTTVTLAALGDQITEADETVVVTLIGGPTYNAGAASSATATIKDCTLTIAATDADVKEPNTNNQGKIRITRNNTSTAALAVPVQWSGSATLNTDYTATPAITTTATIPANATFVDIAIAAKADALVEGTESATLALQPSTTTPFAVTGAWSATALIEDATLTITASGYEVTENANDQVWLTVTRTGDFGGTALNVAFALTGATPDVDYTSSVPSGSLSIAAGNASAPSVSITTNRNDTTAEGDETITATIGPSSYGIITNSVAISLHDDDVPTVDLTVTDAAVSESGPDTGTFTLTRSGPTTTALTVTLTRSGTAAAVTDYTATPTSITGTGTITVQIPVGAVSASITITPVNDTSAELAESVILSVVPQAAYRVGQAQAQLSISDNEQPVITIATTAAQAAEGGALGVLTLQRTGDPTTAISVGISTTGSTAIAGTDYATLTSPVVLDANVTTKDIYITPIDDVLPEGSEAVTVTLQAPGTGYVLGTATTATITIADNDLPTVTVTALQPNAAEGTTPVTGTVRFTRTGDTTTTLSVPFTRSGTASTTLGTDYTITPNVSAITFPANAPTVDLVITPINNAVASGDKTVVVTLGTGSFTAGSDSSATVTIGDDELPTLSITAIDNVADENGLDTATVTITRSAASALPLVVPYTIEGSANPGADYLALPGSVSIPANQRSVMITITPRDDLEVEVNESITLTIGSVANCILDFQRTQAIITLKSDELPAPHIAYQTGSALQVDTFGEIPGGFDLVEIEATTAQTGLTLTTRMEGGTFAIRGLLATPGVTSATVQLRFKTSTGTYGPPAIESIKWASSGIIEGGNPDTLPIFPPTIEISVAETSLTGDKRGTIDGNAVLFTNTNGDSTVPVVIQVSASTYGGASVSSIEVICSNGQNEIVPGSSGNANFIIPTDGTYRFSARALATRSDRSAVGISQIKEPLIVDRSKPVFAVLADKKYSENGGKQLEISTPGKKWYTATDLWSPIRGSRQIYLNGNPEDGATGNKALRGIRKQMAFNASGFAVDLIPEREISGLSTATMPTLNGMPDWQISKIDGSHTGEIKGFHLSLASENEVYGYGIWQTKPKDRAGNEVADVFQGWQYGLSKTFNNGSSILNFDTSVAYSPVLAVSGFPYWFPEIWVGSPVSANRQNRGHYQLGFPLNVPISLATKYVHPGTTEKSTLFTIRDQYGNLGTSTWNWQGLHDARYGGDCFVLDGVDPQAHFYSFLGVNADQDANITFPSSARYFVTKINDAATRVTSGIYSQIVVHPQSVDVQAISGPPIEPPRTYFLESEVGRDNFDGIDSPTEEVKTWYWSYWAVPYLPGNGNSRKFSPAIFTANNIWDKERQAQWYIKDQIVSQMSGAEVSVGGSNYGPAFQGPYEYKGNQLLGKAVVTYPGDSVLWATFPARANYDGEWTLSLRSPMPWMNSIRIAPDIVTVGNRQTVTIYADFLGGNTYDESQFSSSGKYVTIYNAGSPVSYTREEYLASRNTPAVDSKICIVGQRFIYSPDLTAHTQAIELDLIVGCKVPSGLFDIDVKLGAIKSFDDPLSKNNQGENGAHRMNKALAVVRFGAETETDPDGKEIERMISVPKLSLNAVSVSNLSVSGGRVTVALSGSVADQLANQVSSSSIKRIVASQFDRDIGSMNLTPAAGSASDWKPYAKTLNFNGSVSFDAVDGIQTIELKTDANEMGFRGIGAINVECKALSPNPYYSEVIKVSLSGALSATGAEVATLTLPGQYIGTQSSAITLTETGPNTRVFNSGDGVYRIEIPLSATLDAGLVDELPITISKSGVVLSDLAHLETDAASLVFIATRTSQVATSVTSLVYRINASGLSSQPRSITTTLPAEIAGPSAAPVVLAETEAGTFVGSLGENVITVVSGALTGAPPSGSFLATIQMNGALILDGTFAPSAPGHISTVSTATTIKTVSANISQQTTAQSTGTPYRVVFDAPKELREKIVSNYDVYQDGSKIELVKQGEKYYRGKNGKPDVMAAYGLDSGKVPGDPKIATSSILLYTGTVTGYTSNGISVSRTVTVQFSPEGLEGEPPRLVNVNIIPITSALGTISRVDNDKKLKLAGKHNLDLPEGNYGGALTLCDIVADPANFVLKPKANAQENFGELYGRDTETALNVKIPAWSWVTSEQRSGFIWNEDEQLREVPILWTLPPYDYHTTYSLRSAIELALEGPVANTGDEKIRKRTLNLFTSLALELDYLELENIKRLYTWTVTKGVYTQADADANKIPVGFQIGDFRKEIRTEDGQRVDLTRLIEDGFNKDIRQQNAAAYTAWEARRNLGAKMARAGLTFNVERMTEPDGYLKVLTLATTIADPFYWCGVLAGETTIKLPTAEESTWAAVGFGAGSLVVDALPFGKLLRAGGKLLKKARNLFKRDVPLEPTKQVTATTENCAAHCVKGGCFAGEQLVITERGLIPIKEVRVGDYVLSRDVIGHREGYKMVSALRKTKPNALISLEFVCANGGRFQICGTPGHLIWDSSGLRWVSLSEVTSNDCVTLPGGRRAHLVERTWRASGGYDFEAYDLTVDEWSTFFVGDHDGFILAHNNTPQQDACNAIVNEARSIVAKFKHDKAKVKHEFTQGEFRNLGPEEMYQALGGNRFRRPRPGSVKSIDPKDINLDTDWLPDCVITMNNGKVIPFSRGFPDFARFRHPRAPSIVKIVYTGDKDQDFKAALKEALSQGMLRDVPISKSTSAPIGYVWHHNQRMGVMELVEEEAHNVAKEIGGAAHTGGWAIYKKLMEFGIPIKYE